jgi:hypothetical protein
MKVKKKMSPSEFFLVGLLKGISMIAQIPIYGGIKGGQHAPQGRGLLVSESQFPIPVINILKVEFK